MWGISPTRLTVERRQQHLPRKPLALQNGATASYVSAERRNGFLRSAAPQATLERGDLSQFASARHFLRARRSAKSGGEREYD